MIAKEPADPYQVEYDASDRIHSVDWSDKEKSELYTVEMEDPLRKRSVLQHFFG